MKSKQYVPLCVCVRLCKCCWIISKERASHRTQNKIINHHKSIVDHHFIMISCCWSILFACSMSASIPQAPRFTNPHPVPLLRHPFPFFHFLPWHQSRSHRCVLSTSCWCPKTPTQFLFNDQCHGVEVTNLYGKIWQDGKISVTTQTLASAHWGLQSSPI